MSTSKMSLKLLIDAKRNKVIFAEAGKDFVDFLLGLLALPRGSVIRLLTKSTTIGCISSLYGSLEKLDESYLQPNQNKDSILKPTTTTQSPIQISCFRTLKSLKTGSYTIANTIQGTCQMFKTLFVVIADHKAMVLDIKKSSSLARMSPPPQIHRLVIRPEVT